MSVPVDSQPAAVVSDSASAVPTRLSPRRVWMFYDFDLFRRSSRLCGVRLQSAWSSFFLRAEARGDAWEPLPGRRDARAALELSILRRDCGLRERVPGSGVSVFEFAHGNPDTPGWAPGGEGPVNRLRGFTVSLHVDFALFRDATGLQGVDLQSAWCRLWCVAEAEGSIADDPPSVVFDVGLAMEC